MTQYQEHKEDHENQDETHQKHSLLEWCIIATIAILGLIGLFQGIVESSALFEGICGFILTGISIILIRDRYHTLLEHYEFPFIWLVILGIAAYGIYHVLTGVFLIL